MIPIIYKNIFKEKTSLLEADFRGKIKNVFKVTDDVADFVHRINDKLSIWIVDTLFKQIIKERHFVRDQVITFLNTSSDDRDNYLKVFKDRMIYVLDYYANPIGKQEYPSFDKFKQEDFDVLHKKSEDWHNSLKSRNVKTAQVKDTEPNVEILKQYEPNEYGVIYYWADLNKKYSQIESSRMGHCGTTHMGDTLLSLRSFTPSSEGTYINKSHVTLALNRKNKIYVQLKGKQNRKPSINYRQYIFDLFMFDKDIQGYEPEYEAGTDFKVSDLTSAQIKSLIKINPSLVKQYISPNFMKFQEDIKNLSPEEVYTTYIENLSSESIQSLHTKNSTDEMLMSQVINECLPIVIRDNSIFNKIVNKYINFIEKNQENHTRFVIESTIIEYCIFSNNFGKIKNRIDYFAKNEFSEQETINKISTFCFYTEQYPDYFSSYSSKLIEPLAQQLLREELDFNDILEIYGNDTKNVIKKLMIKEKDKYRDILYPIFYEELKEFENSDAFQNQGPLELQELIKKIKDINSILEGSSALKKFQKEIMSLYFFKTRKFKDVQISYLYFKEPNLINYSLYSDFDSNFMNDNIETELELDELPIYSGRRRDDKVDITSILEQPIDYIDNPDWSFIEDYLDDLESKKDKKEDFYVKVYDRIVSAIEEESGKTYSEILEEYDVTSLSDAIENLNDNNEIDNFYSELENCFRYAIEFSITNEYGNKYEKALIYYAKEIGINLKEIYLYENRATAYLSVKELLAIFEEHGEETEYGNSVLDISSFSYLLDSYISFKEVNLNNIYVNFDNIYGDYDTEEISNYVLDYI